VEEALDEIPEAPTHVFAPGGAGSVAAAASVQLRQRFGTAPRLVVVEPEHDARLLDAALAGTVAALPDAAVDGPADEVPSLLAWQELERAAFAFMALPQRRSSAPGPVVVARRRQRWKRDWPGCWLPGPMPRRGTPWGWRQAPAFWCWATEAAD
jgi:hypothetical protein